MLWTSPNGISLLCLYSDVNLCYGLTSEYKHKRHRFHETMNNRVDMS